MGNTIPGPLQTRPSPPERSQCFKGTGKKANTENTYFMPTSALHTHILLGQVTPRRLEVLLGSGLQSSVEGASQIVSPAALLLVLGLAASLSVGWTG